MTATQLERSLVDEIRHLTDEQRRYLLELARSMRGLSRELELPPLKLNFSSAASGAWSREEIYGDDGR